MPETSTPIMLQRILSRNPAASDDRKKIIQFFKLAIVVTELTSPLGHLVEYVERVGRAKDRQTEVKNTQEQKEEQE